MSKLLSASPSPYVRTQIATKGIMYGVAITMILAAAYSMYQFGIKALLIILVIVVAYTLSESVYQGLVGLSVTISDGSALVTGLTLVLNIPPEIPLWIPFLSGVSAIIIVKQVLGGLGQNFMSPALAVRCFLLISPTGRTSVFALDGAFGATPLAVVGAGQQVNITAMSIGRIPETVDEVSTLVLLIEAAYFSIEEVISIRTPGTYALAFAIFMFLFGGMGGGYVLAQAYGGGLIFSTFLMAADYMTNPITARGQIVFGILLGILTGTFRLWGGFAEGVSYAIILHSIFVPLIEGVTVPVAFGFGEGSK